MRNTILYLFVIAAFIVAFSACNNQTQQTHQGEWLTGDDQQVIDEIENQFAGFSQTMWEVHYRFIDLYWAGIDANWQYADYQLEHIVEALEQGFVRRPEREASSAQFVNQSVPALMQTIIAADQEGFAEQFSTFTATCNSCHAMEDVAFITVEIPQVRSTAVRF